MSVAPTVSCVEEFVILLVDDDEDACDMLRTCLENVPKCKVEYLKVPEAIEDYEENFPVIILDILFDKVNKIGYLLDQVKEKWPGSIIIILSYYEKELSWLQRRRVDAIVNKTKLLLEPKLLRDNLIEIIPKHQVGMDDVSREFLENLTSLKERETEIELHRVRGYVLRKKGEYIEVDICEKVTTGKGVGETENVNNVRQKVLLPYELFEKHDLCDYGTPIILRIYRKGGQIITEPRLDEDADKPAAIPKEVQKLLDALEKKDKQLLKDIKKDE